MSQARLWAIVAAAGRGRRMDAGVPKQYLPLAGATVLHHALAPLLGCTRIERVLVVVHPQDTRWAASTAARDPRVRAVPGAEERCRSVLAGLRALGAEAAARDWVLVHDAARPCLRAEDLERLIDEVLAAGQGGLLGAPVRDTLKRVADARVSATEAREGLWRAFTPQMFPLGALREALDAALDAGELPSDEAQAMERAGTRPLPVEGREDNLKITRPGDLELAEAILRARRGERAAGGGG